MSGQRANPGGRISVARGESTAGNRSSRRRVVERPDYVFYRWFRAPTGPGNRPFARAGGGPEF